VIALFVGVFAAILLVTVATAEPARITERQPSLPWELPELDLRIDVPPTTVAADAEGTEGTDDGSTSWELITGFLQLVLAALALIAAGSLLRHLWRRRPDFDWGRRSAPDDFLLLDDLADVLVADAEAQHAVLRTGAARNAIVECWLRLETAVEAAGIEHDPALTSAELTSHVLGRFDVDPAAIGRLAALYREARFSTHRLGEPQRAAAIEALDALHAGLRNSDRAVTR
jgi:hypothetical protein